MQAAHPLCLHSELAMLPQVPAATAGKAQATRSCVPARFGPLHAYCASYCVVYALEADALCGSGKRTAVAHVNAQCIQIFHCKTWQ